MNQKCRPKLKHELKKISQKLALISGKNFQRILCKNRTKLLLNSTPGVYQLDFRCNRKYTGKSKNKVETCSIEFVQDSMKRNWKSYAAHSKLPWRISLVKPQNISTISIYVGINVRKALEINKLGAINKKEGKFRVLNRDDGGVFVNIS